MLSTSKSGSDDTAPGGLPVVKGSWFVAGSALRHTATLTLARALLEIRGDGQGADYPVAQARVAELSTLNRFSLAISQAKDVRSVYTRCGEVWDY